MTVPISISTQKVKHLKKTNKSKNVLKNIKKVTKNDKRSPNPLYRLTVLPKSIATPPITNDTIKRHDKTKSTIGILKSIAPPPNPSQHQSPKAQKDKKRKRKS